MTGGDWISEAMCDELVVAEALICLLHSQSLPPMRSKAAPFRKKGDHNTRASPTTPLSWSGAISFSGGAGDVDGFEESSAAVKHSEAVRSKICQTSVTTTTSFKRSRKKKTLGQLKEEESLLLKERKSLKNELASMQDLLKQQRAKNASLKKRQVESQKSDHSSFLLPDLNIPLENNLSPDIHCGTS